MTELKISENPFYDNHIFSISDIRRIRPTLRDRLRFLLCPTLVQISAKDNLVFFFKINKWGEYLLIKYEHFIEETKTK